ncbi:ClpB protein, partial [hydrothermal vent metagenome]
MQNDKFTLKSQEALQNSQRIAEQNGQQEIVAEHLLQAILEQQEGAVVPVLQKMGVTPETVTAEAQRLLSRLPKVSGSGFGQVYLSAALKKTIDEAFKLASKMQDEYVSQEHLFMAILEEKGSAVAKALQGLGINSKSFMQALAAIRGSQRVTDPDPEGKYQALEKYGRNLTLLAKQGKLDPVIGRDDEVRRVVQVLARRTKNNPVLIGEPG